MDFSPVCQKIESSKFFSCSMNELLEDICQQIKNPEKRKTWVKKKNWYA